MTALDTDDLAVVTGPLEVQGTPDSVYLVPGEVVRVEEGLDPEDDTIYVYGMESGRRQYIDATSLTPLSEIQDDPEVVWGKSSYVSRVFNPYSEIHDYVYEGE